MQVFLIRHAEAAGEILTAHGRLQAQHLGDCLRWHDCVPAHVWSSPEPRAVATAELVVASLHLELVVERAPDLAPDADPRKIVAAIRGLPRTAIVLVVGHERGLSAIGGLLIARPAFALLDLAQAARIVDGELKWTFAWDADAPALPGR